MQVKPRYAGQIIAIHLAADLMAEAGNYVIIAPDHTIEIVTTDDFKRMFEVVNGVEAPSPSKGVSATTSKAQKAQVPQKPRPPQRYRLGTHHKILLAFGPKIDGTFQQNMSISALTRLLPKVPMPLLLEKVSMLTRAKKLTSVTQNDQVLYNLTDAGKTENRELRSRPKK